MYDFWIGTQDYHTHLDGGDCVDPVRGMLMTSAKAPSTATPSGTAAKAPGETTEDLLLVDLNDRDVGECIIDQTMSLFDHYFDQARLYASAGLGQAVVLHAEPVEGEDWESPVMDGWSEFGGKGSQVGARLLGSMALTLHVTRCNYWQAAEVQLETISPGGDDGLTGSTLELMEEISGEDEGLHVNAMVIAPSVAEPGPDLPSPMRLEIKNIRADPVDIGHLYVSQNVNSECQSRSYCLDDADASGGESQSDADAYCGTYKACAFSDTAAADLLTWPLADAFCQDCKGNFFRFILRLNADLAYTDLELKMQLRLSSTSSVVGETDWLAAVPGERLQVFSAMRLPPYHLVDLANAAGLDLVLVARRSTLGSHTLSVDYLQLMPLDGWRHYRPLYALEQNWTLVDNGARGIVSSLDTSGKEQITHIAVGQPFYLAPHVPIAFYFAWMTSDGQAHVMSAITVKAYVSKRRRLL